MRFVLLSFGFLAFAFYELSGGADYEPRTQRSPIFAPVPDMTVTRMASEPGAIVPRVSTRQSEPAPQDAVVVPASLQTDPSQPTPVQADLNTGLNAGLIDSDKANDLLAAPDTSETRVTVSLGLATPQAPETSESQDPKDLREISGNRVNMRTGPGTTFSVVAKLTEGEAVEVIGAEGDGWLQLRVIETGQVGYMADWLVTARAN